MEQRTIPYFSQWESRSLTSTVLAEGAGAALARDPLWASSGASSVEEYARWAGHLCGMACLKMVLSALTGDAFQTLKLAHACTDYGGYVVNPDDGSIKGLIYAPFVLFISERFGLESRVVTGIAAEDVPAIMRQSKFFMALVHHAIRWPDRDPPAKGGHLVLVTAATADGIVFHNPSGHTPASQENVTMPIQVFARFFAGRGVALAPWEELDEQGS